jgi:hypothetical protein
MTGQNVQMQSKYLLFFQTAADNIFVAVPLVLNRFLKNW